MNELEKLKQENESMKKVLFVMHDLMIPELPSLMKKIKSKEIKQIQESLIDLGHPTLTR